MRSKLIAGNWKMNGTLAEARHLLFQISELWQKDFEKVEVAVCPPFTALSLMQRSCEETKIAFGAQNCYFAGKGAFTGEISAAMLAELGCKYVILGHSERRAIFKETDEVISKKVRAVIDAGITAILCIGESESERGSGATESVLAKQLAGSLATISAVDTPTLVVAYEPVWAIGTGKTATPAQAQEAHAFIRSELRKKFGSAADSIRILYGGSVKPENAGELFSCADIDGGLIGGASLDAESFIAIIAAASRLQA